MLRPGNVAVVMNMGDSISAGAVMTGLPVEERGLVFSIGGSTYTSDFSDEKALTIPNFLLNYNPKLQGQAYGTTILFTKGTYLSAAVSSARIQDVPPQVDYLVSTMKSSQYNTHINFENDWKLLTLFIGANNLCTVCLNRTEDSPKYFETKLREIVSSVRDKIPKVFVNLLGIFNISGVWTTGQNYEYCRFLWDDITRGECPCLLTYGNEGRQMMDDYSVYYNQVMMNIAQEFSSAKTGNKNFTVVYQPGPSGTNISYIGEDFLSPLDCFHPNLAGDEGFAIGLWNNMFSPPAKKQSFVDPNDIYFVCPDQNSFLQ